MEEYEGKDGLDRLIELLDQNGMEHSDVYEDTFRSMAFFDRAGSPHECWPAGSHELVNVVVAMTPENAVSFDIDGVFDENAKLRTLLEESLMDTREYAEKYGVDPSYDSVNEHLDSRLRELGIGGA